MGTNPFDQFDSVEENPFDQFDNPAVNTPAPDAPDFVPGMQRGLQNLQAMTYGAGALAGGGLKKLGAESVGQKLQDVGMEGYRRNVEEAKQYPKKHSFKDIYTGKTGVGGAIDWAQGTLGELVPSMVEAAGGAAIGSALAGPGAGTAVGAFAGRSLLKKGIEKTVQQTMKKAANKLTEAEVRKQATRQAMKKLGGKAGIAGAVMPMESGGMYADLLEEKGIDAPGTALFFGALATSMEFFGGNSKLVDTFVDALSNGSKGIMKRSAREILTNIPQEALQEGGQELMGILNTVANTDEELLTWDNVEQIVEGMAAGAIGGGAGALLQAGMGSQAQDPSSTKIPQEIELDRRATNILTQDKEGINKSIQTLNTGIQLNDSLLLSDSQAIAAKAEELNITPDALIKQTIADNKDKQDLINKITAGITEQSEPPVNTKIWIDGKRDFEKEKEFAKQAADRKVIIDTEFNQRQEEIEKDKIKLDSGEISSEEFIQKYELSSIVSELMPQQTDQIQESVALKQEDNLTTKEGKPYKNKQYLKGIISELEDSENYEIVESPDGFTGVKKVLGKADTSPFTDEHQVDGDPQFQVIDMPLYHGSRSEIIDGEFKPTEYGDFGRGVYTTPSLRFGNSFRDMQNFGVSGKDIIEGAKGNLFEVSINISKEKIFGGEKEITIEERAFWENDGSDLNEVSTHDELQDQETAANDPGGSWITSAAWDRFLDEFGYDAVQNSNQVMVRDPKKIKVVRTLEESEIQEGLRNDKYGKLKKAKFNRLAEDILPGMVYDGEVEGLHYFTPMSGPSRGGTIATLDPSREGITKALEAGQKRFADDPQSEVRENVETVGNITLEDVKRAFPDQDVYKAKDGIISIKLKNGKGVTIKSIQYAGQDLIRMAIDTGQMSPTGTILGITTGNEILLDSNFADNKTLWHENKHVLDNLGMITTADNSALNKEFNKLRKLDKLEFALSKHKDTVQAMVENRANMFAQIMVNRETYRNTPLGKVIQRVMDFFQQMLSFGKQSISGLAREVESGKIYKRQQAKALREGMAMFEVREGVVEQKLSDAEYAEIHAEKNNLLKELAQQARMKFTEVRLLADKAFGAISTRLKNVDPELAQHLRWLDFNTSQKIIDVLKTAKPLLDATKRMSPEDKSAWNWARLNSDEGKIEQLAQKYSLTDDQIALREKLNKIREDAIKVGYDVGFIDEYWPRVIKDQEGFLQATQEISQRPVFTEAIRAQAKKLGLTQKQFEREFPEVKADIISNLILGQPTGIGGPGNIQSRVFETIPKEYAKFYMDADAALMQYVYSMTKKIEARKFFGKVPKRISDLKSAKKQKTADLIKYEQLADMARAENPEALIEYEKQITKLNEDIVRIDEPLNEYRVKNNYTENIGSYIDRMRVDGRIKPKDEKMVRDILDARFHEHGTTGIINAYKNLSYIDTMGSPLSAITQIGDLAWAMYVGKVWTPKGFSDTIKHTTQALFKQSKITKEDLGIERIAQEFADGTTLSKGVSKVFKYVGLEKIDTIGKEVLINNALSQYKAEAKNNPEALAKLIKPTFGAKSTEVVQEILAETPSDNVKMLLYSRLLDFQPVALSEMPEYYLSSGNGRVFYMLKTYTLKQFDVFRKEVVHNLKSKNPQQKLQGIANMVQLMALLTIANATADEIKDFMLGRETRFSDNVIENFLTIGGASRYLKMQVSREGFGSALAQQILPPMKFINSVSKDLNEGYKDYVSGDTSNFEHARIIDSIPGLGKLYYWHHGRGSENKKSLAENDFKKVAKDARLFKKQLENSDDKRFFIESNLDRFKQMKLQENFQSALSRNKAVINKLEKIPSTENVQTRLGQLKAQREQILQRYFDVAETMI